jgi:hypothetical protein
MRVVDAVNPSRIEIEEIENDVSDVGDRENEEEARGIGGGDGKYAEIEDQARPHGPRGRPMPVDVTEVPWKPSIDRALVQRPRGSRHCRHDREDVNRHPSLTPHRRAMLTPSERELRRLQARSCGA